MAEQLFFVSHSYEDDASLQALLKAKLPEGSSPKIFQKIDTANIGLLSEVIMPAIQACHGLIYIRSKRSFDSFWAAFERNYALRLGKPVYGFEPDTGKFQRDVVAAIDPVISSSWNLAVPRDSFMVRDITLYLNDKHRFNTLGKHWKLIDNDFRQMVDSVDGIELKLAAGGLVVLFLSNDSISCGWHDYADPYEEGRTRKDMETPIGLTGEKFGLFPPERTFVVWLDVPDRQRIETALAGFDAPHWAPYVRRVRAALEEENQCIVVKKSLNDIAAAGRLSLLAQKAYERVLPDLQPPPRSVDDILVRATHMAYMSSPDFRLKLSSQILQK